MSNEESPSLPPGAEQIGPLIFVPLEEPPGEEFKRIRQDRPPRFWMEERSGALAAAVEGYINGERVSPEQFNLLKIYLRQYVERAILTGDAQRPRLITRVENLHSLKDIERLADDLAEYGAEPF